MRNKRKALPGAFPEKADSRPRGGASGPVGLEGVPRIADATFAGFIRHPASQPVCGGHRPGLPRLNPSTGKPAVLGLLLPRLPGGQLLPLRLALAPAVQFLLSFRLLVLGHSSLLLRIVRGANKKAGESHRLLIYFKCQPQPKACLCSRRFPLSENPDGVNVKIISCAHRPAQNFTVLMIISYSWISSWLSSRRSSFLLTMMGHFTWRARATASLGRLSKTTSSSPMRT